MGEHFEPFLTFVRNQNAQARNLLLGYRLALDGPPDDSSSTWDLFGASELRAAVQHSLPAEEGRQAGAKSDASPSTHATKPTLFHTRPGLVDTQRLVGVR